MRWVWMGLLLLALAFAVGGGGGGGGSSSGGGGGGTPKIDYELTYNFSCPENELTVTAEEDNDALSGATVNLHKQGFRIDTETTDSKGEVHFTIREASSYQVYASKSGYKTKDASFRLELCEPEQTAPAEVWLCNEGTRTERAQCRLRLDAEDVKNVRYIPEECREREEAGKQQCIGWYRLFQTCQHGLETDAEREACIKPKLNISGEVHTVLAECQEQVGTLRALCVQQIKERVFTLVKFRMYNLEYKIEEWLEAGVSEEDAADMLLKVQDAKLAFSRAPSIAEKKAVVLQLKADWQAFVENADAELGVEE